ncbi:beta-lactamase superfamily domain-containing protein [Fusarium flagelliforme]|uniref:beta-lactamase superfamily domain-containing protein n=1 Tax=Fusarium flagelliforme TaxID=2675880 RepID=UPI001E8CB2BE|nr:beta-lactamase superfamily domain-containing protein [Fusarium flagelliforme]KAH7188422.1 beta-lactamase superfamily domain-containing protein [Fusarium flagelliforme]
MSDKGSINLALSKRQPLLKDKSAVGDDQSLLPKATKTHPKGSKGDENANVYFIGTATTIIEWQGFRLLTDPNFLHAGDHVHLGPGVTAQRQTDPAVDLDELPSLDGILLSHYHEDHFDRLVEDSLNRDFLIVTTPHAHQCLTSKDPPFTNVKALDFFDHLKLKSDDAEAGKQAPVINVTGMPGKHVPPGPLAAVNDILGAVPPTNGWMIELGYHNGADDKVQTGYRIYISGDTLLVDELKDIPKWLQDERIDLMLIHLGGTTIPGPSAPLIMVTMDAKQGVEMIKMMNPDVTIPIHYDDYDVFLSPRKDFETAVKEAGLEDRVVLLDRGDRYKFAVRKD